MILKDKVVIVTGVGPGMGRHLAAAVAREGAHVVMAARNKDFLGEISHEIQSAGHSCLAVPTDVAVNADCQNIVKQALEKFGKIDGLVNSAYYHPAFESFEQADFAEWQKAMDVICFGALQMIRATLPALKDNQGGSIVNIGTLTTRKPMPGEMGYAVAKGALSQITRHLAVELGAYNIRVNQALMGWMLGAPLQGYFDHTAAQTGASVADLMKTVSSRISLGRIPADADCAKAVLMLLSDYTSEVTGAMLDVNGGEWVAP